jgi:hypothetical protein
MHISTGNDFETRIWGEESAYFGTVTQSYNLAVEDFNGDGKTDIGYWGEKKATATLTWESGPMSTMTPAG